MDVAATSVELNTILRLFSPPDYVRAADADTLYPPKSAARGLFGDPVNLLYPCHTKAATWLSMARHVTAERPVGRDVARADLIRNRIKKAGAWFKIAADFERIEKKAESIGKPDLSQLDDNDFALVLDGPKGKEQHYRLLNPGEVKTASDYLRKYGPHFTYEERQAFASKVLAKAASMQLDAEVDADGWLSRQAGRGFCSAGDAASLLFERAKMLQSLRRAPEHQEKLAELALAFLQHPEFCHKEQNLVKAADLVDKIDREFRLDRLGVVPPEDVFFGLTIEKMAGFRKDAIALNSGAVYRIADLQPVLGVPERELAEAVGYPVARQVHADGIPSMSKLAETLELVNRAQADRVEEGLLKRFNLQPIGRMDATELANMRDNLTGLAALKI